MKALVEQGVGLAEVQPDSALAQQLASMTKGGSDVAGAIRQEVDLLQQRGGGTLVVRSDGLQRSGDVDFSASVERSGVSRAARALGPLLPANAEGVAIAIAGLGITGGDVDQARAQLLVAVWDAACRRTRADRCSIKTAAA